jgi:hypothetical protein
VFSLPDVLGLLAATGQTGELQIVGDAVDGRLWFDGGLVSDALVAGRDGVTQAVFELACVVDGWFSFVEGVRVANGEPARSVASILAEVGPQVEEWRSLRLEVPLDATVVLSTAPPGDDVRLSASQWPLLTAVGPGRSVAAVVDAVGGEPVETLKGLRDLCRAGLVVVTSASARSVDLPAPDPAPPLAGTATEERAEELAPVSVMPPPIVADPWTPAPEPVVATEESGAA